MATIEDVQEAALRRWPPGMPSWPDPHGGEEPAQEEYSRVTDGERYRIVVERARAWTDACAEVLGARVTNLGQAADSGGRRGGWVVTSPRRGTAPLRIEVFEWELASVVLGCGDAHDIERVPDCGCDACDPGSEALLDGIDDWFVNALTGGLAHIWDEQWSATSNRSGQRCGGAADAPVQMDFADACTQLHLIASGGDPQVPDGLCWVWSGRWVD